MPYVSLPLLDRSLGTLRKYPTLLIISISNMLMRKRPTVPTQQAAEAVHERFGSREEREYLEKYFVVAGGPPGCRWFNPSKRIEGTKTWLNGKDLGGNLQRQKSTAARRGILFRTEPSPRDVGYAFR